MKDERFMFLRRVYFFKDLSDEEIGLVAAACSEESCQPGDILFVEGSKADRFYIVINGRVEVWKNFYDAKPDLLAIHGPGHFFGEMALVDELPRSATVVAKDPTRVLYLYRDDFRELIKTRSSIALSIMMSISFMVRSANEVFVEDLRRRNKELEEALKELEEAQAALLRDERLSTLGKFSSMILHDIRNPISILKGQFQLMGMNLRDPERLEGNVRNAVEELGRLERLAAEFLDYSRGEIRLDIVVASPAELLRRTASAMAESLSKSGVGSRIECSFDGPALLDEDRVLRALYNISDNARKAMAGKGGELVLKAYAEGGFLVFEAADSGEGMDADVLSHMFEPFYSRSKQGGTGLGMLIVKNVVEAHGGSVKILSEPGRGTRALLYFPLRG